MKSMEEDNLQKIISPQTGKCIPIVDVPDEVFSEKILGDGVAIIPNTNEVLSPIKGVIDQVTETGHAFCIKSDDGLDIMIHIGVDTVNLKGEGFKCFVKNGDIVNVGDKLATADIGFIKKMGYPLHTSLLITNINSVKSMNPYYGEVVAGETCVIKYEKNK